MAIFQSVIILYPPTKIPFYVGIIESFLYVLVIRWYSVYLYIYIRQIYRTSKVAISAITETLTSQYVQIIYIECSYVDYYIYRVWRVGHDMSHVHPTSTHIGFPLVFSDDLLLWLLCTIVAWTTFILDHYKL